MNPNLSNFLRKFEEHVGLRLQSIRDLISLEQKKPLSAAIFGQTGCGKSSLTNAIFGTHFDVDDVKPCTKLPQAHHGHDSKGHRITFWDLPGIGESAEADSQYLDMYADYAAKCDVVLWAFQADTRTMTCDSSALNAIVEKLGPDKKSAFLNRLSVVVTKADVISPTPWIFAKNRGNATVAASRETEEMLDKKATYFYDGLLGVHQADVIHRTYVTSEIRHLTGLFPDFWLDDSEAFLCHKGTLDNASYTQLVDAYPEARDELSRLREQSRAVCCSARYGFNLNAVKAKIAQKTTGKSVLRLSQSVSTASSAFSWSKVKALGLPVFFDQEKNELIFDVETVE
ncbi:GTPase [Methylocystis sp. IM3]|jgi:GTP-binding protein EngB required for normal cell division|uniref:GTPase family protein n=1 Tax=unclassified Methylocystis TaxID=2625913 RepID=UPI0030FBD441